MKDLPKTATQVGWRFDNSYLRLPETFYARLAPLQVSSPHLAIFNFPLAKSLGLNIAAYPEDEIATIFAGNVLPKGAQPIAQAYAGHQYGNFTMLGDGRAILLGEQITAAGERFDIQLKGSGQTPYSRGGDGRAALGPMLREYIVSEAMYGLGIPTTRSLAVVTTGQPVFREQALPGAILARVAASHIRVGTFEYAEKYTSHEEVQILADYVIRRHYPQQATADNPYLALLQEVVNRQASLIAKWMLVGFVHGVMNTDNMTISGETIDYGPCAFMDAYDPATVFSSIDRHGRYAYARQPEIAHWNLARFAESLLPLLHKDEKTAVELAEETLNIFPTTFGEHWLSGVRAKIGLFTHEAEDISLIESLFQWMEHSRADFTNTFRNLSLGTLPAEQNSDATFSKWHGEWQARVRRQPDFEASSRTLMLSHNPEVIPRNHRVEEALLAATQASDFTLLQRLLSALQDPYAERGDRKEYLSPPASDGPTYRTFCGT